MIRRFWVDSPTAADYFERGGVTLEPWTLDGEPALVVEEAEGLGRVIYPPSYVARLMWQADEVRAVILDAPPSDDPAKRPVLIEVFVYGAEPEPWPVLFGVLTACFVAVVVLVVRWWMRGG